MLVPAFLNIRRYVIINITCAEKKRTKLTSSIRNIILQLLCRLGLFLVQANFSLLEATTVKFAQLKTFYILREPTATLPLPHKIPTLRSSSDFLMKIDVKIATACMFIFLYISCLQQALGAATIRSSSR